MPNLLHALAGWQKARKLILSKFHGMNKKKPEKDPFASTIILGGMKATEADKKAVRDAIAKRRAQRRKKAA